MAERQIIPGVPQFIDTTDETGFPVYMQAWYNNGGRKPIWVFGAPQANRIEIGFMNLDSDSNLGTFLNLKEIAETSATNNLYLGSGVNQWIAVGGIYAQITAINYYDPDGTDDNDQTISIDVTNRVGNYNSFHMALNPVYLLNGDPR